MSDNFSNTVQNATEQSMNVGMQDPNGMQAPNQSAGGKTKINKTDLSDLPSVDGYGYMSPDIKNVAPPITSGDNSSGIPAAQPIPIMTSGDPNNTALDADDTDLKGGHL